MGRPGQTQRRSLEFQLHARPDAVLDPAPVLQEAGHVVQARCASCASTQHRRERTLTEHLRDFFVSCAERNYMISSQNVVTSMHNTRFTRAWHVQLCHAGGSAGAHAPV